jgi:hypothetical protein
MVKKVTILKVLFLVMLSFPAVAQEKIEGISICVDSVVATIDTNNTYIPLVVKILPKKIILKENSLQYEFKQDEILLWIDKVQNDSIKAFKLNNANFTYYVLSSQIKQATGLGINFTSWLIIDSQSCFIVEFESLSRNIRLIYFDSQTEKIRFIRFTYGESFFWSRDWDNIDYKIELNEIDRGNTKIIMSKDSKCTND